MKPTAPERRGFTELATAPSRGYLFLVKSPGGVCTTVRSFRQTASREAHENNHENHRHWRHRTNREKDREPGAASRPLADINRTIREKVTYSRSIVPESVCRNTTCDESLMSVTIKNRCEGGEPSLPASALSGPIT